MMRIWFGLILKITVSERISKITARTKSYVSLKNAISQNDLIHKRNCHSFQGPTPINPQLIQSPACLSIITVDAPDASAFWMNSVESSLS